MLERRPWCEGGRRHRSAAAGRKRSQASTLENAIDSGMRRQYGWLYWFFEEIRQQDGS